jgi:hypothetical protein
VVLLGSACGGAVLVEVHSASTRSMAAVENQHPVEHFAANRSDPSFSDRVRSGRWHRCAQDADALACEHGVKSASERDCAR